MPRGKIVPVEQKIEKIDEEITKLTERIEKLKAQKGELNKALRAKKISELDALISEKGLSVEEVKAMLEK